jgi:hypothetical protein
LTKLLSFYSRLFQSRLQLASPHLTEDSVVCGKSFGGRAEGGKGDRRVNGLPGGMPVLRGHLAFSSGSPSSCLMPGVDRLDGLSRLFR